MNKYQWDFPRVTETGEEGYSRKLRKISKYWDSLFSVELY